MMTRDETQEAADYIAQYAGTTAQAVAELERRGMSFADVTVALNVAMGKPANRPAGRRAAGGYFVGAR